TFNEFDTPATPSIRRPTAVYEDSVIDQPRSPSSRIYDQDTYAKPAHTTKREHTRLYSVDDGNPAQLIAETEVDPRDTYYPSTDRDRGRERRGYHPTGPPTYLRKIDEESFYPDAEGK